MKKIMQFGEWVFSEKVETIITYSFYGLMSMIFVIGMVLALFNAGNA